MKTKTLFIILGILAVGVIVAVAVTSAPKNSTDESAPVTGMTDDVQLLDEEGNPLNQEEASQVMGDDESDLVTDETPEGMDDGPAPAAPDFPVTGYAPQS